jgi:hypothetical protein
LTRGISRKTIALTVSTRALALVAFWSALLVLALPARGAHESSLAFRLRSVETSIRLVDRYPPKGVPSKGDRFVVKRELRNGYGGQFGRPRNALIGRDTWVRTILSDSGLQLVKVTAMLPGGSLRLRARGRVSNLTIVLTVVGGTGRYANARGTCKFQERGGVPGVNDYRLQLP